MCSCQIFGLFAQYFHMNFDGVQLGYENEVAGNKNTPASHSAPCDCSSAVGPDGKMKTLPLCVCVSAAKSL